MTKGCYTCRRRRIICDNGLPTCRKCRVAGKECLGYQKPLVWVKGGVASRGKMMGRSYDDVMQKARDRNGDSESNAEAVRTFEGGTALPGALDNSASTVSDDTVALSPGNLFRRSPTIVPLEDNPSIHTLETFHTPDYIPAPWGLVDPLFKDLSRLSRFYLSHYSQNLVSILALYPHVKNPYRDLITLVGDTPVIAHTLSAMGALHYTLLANGDLPSSSWMSNNPETTATLLFPQEVEGAATGAITRRPVSKSYEHFLNLKQRALHQLSLDIGDPVLRKDDRTVAAILALALLDLIESGSGAWIHHLEGAKNLLRSRQRASSSTKRIVDGLETFVMDGCLLIEIMGSTLARPGALSKPFYSASMGPSILKRLEETSWVGCPAYLLEVIFFVHAYFYSESDANSVTQPTFSFSSSFAWGESPPLQSPNSLLEHIQAFDPYRWAEDMQNCLFLDDLSPRIVLARAYKAAVYLYASRVFASPVCALSAYPISFSLPADHGAVANDLVGQICLIPPSDPHFKCLIWPTFIAGAECRYPFQRAIILDRLNALYHGIISVNVRNAALVLSLMWQKQDLRRQEQEMSHPHESPTSGSSSLDGLHAIDDDFDWIQELGDSRIDWLFI